MFPIPWQKAYASGSALAVRVAYRVAGDLETYLANILAVVRNELTRSY